MKKLLILDLNKNYNIFRENTDVIFLSFGKINLKKAKTLKITEIKRHKQKNKLFKFLENYLKFLKKKQDIFDICELEITNLRNDKVLIFDQLIDLLIIKNELIKKYKTVEIIYDNQLLNNSYQSLSNKKIKLTNLNLKIKKKITFTKFAISRISFFLRVFCQVILSKILCKLPEKLINSEVNLTIRPLLKNDNLYKNQNYNLNFVITDETHINYNLVNNFKLISSLSKQKASIVCEKIISIPDMFYNLFLSLKFKKIIQHYQKKNYYLESIEVSYAINNLLIISILNRLKLNIYDNAIKEIFNKYKIKTFRYFMFEYNFGFYLKNQIQKNNSKVKYIGYQHGIFSKNLMWIDYLIHLNKIHKYIPDNIISTNIFSYKDYKKLLGKKFKISIDDRISKFQNMDLPKYDKKSKNILVILGQHDCNYLINHFEKNKIYERYNIIYKFHPRTNLKDYNKLNLKYINTFKNQKFNKIFVSQTSTLIYYFKIKKFKYLTVEYIYKRNIMNNDLLNF